MMRNSKRTLGRRWGKLLTTALLSAAMLLTAATPAFAVQNINPEKGDCTITLDLKYKDASNVQQQMPDGERRLQREDARHSRKTQARLAQQHQPDTKNEEMQIMCVIAHLHYCWLHRSLPLTPGNYTT